MSESRKKINSSLLLVWSITFVVVGILSVLAVHFSLRALALQEAESKAQMLLDRTLAIHTYFTHDLKPNVFELSEQVEGPDYFDPVWMSSTYAVAAIHRYYEETARSDYYYKECAINARSPENEADEIEAAFLRRTNAEPGFASQTLIREFDGEPYYVVMKRGEQMLETCLRCHSNPDAAPGGLVDKYGPYRSFGREVGEFSSAVSVRIPLASAYAAATDSTRALSLVLISVFGLSLGGTYLYSRRLVLVPAKEYEAQAAALIAAVDTEREVNGELKAVNDELMSTNDALAVEVEARIGAEEDLERYKDGLEALVSERTAELEHAISDAEQASEAKSTFLANVSHDLRTPLNSVIGFSDVLLSGMAGELTSEQSTQVRMINESGKFLLGMVSDLLDLSRFDAPGARATREQFDVAAVASAVVDGFRETSAEKGLTLRCEGCDSVIRMDSDPLLVEQVISNLLGNAVKFTSDGEIVLRLEVHDDERAVRIEIADTGPGIAKEELPYVFEAFRQYGQAASAKPDGAGLGLAISLKIARLLGGTITAKSKLGRGSTFILRLPLVLPDTPEDPNTPIE